MKKPDKWIYVEKQLRRGDQQKSNKANGPYDNVVHYILDITYRIWEERGIGVIRDTYDEQVALHVGLRTEYGRKGVISNTLNTLHTFPDRRLFGEEVIWSKAKGGKFFSSHRIGSTATHLGESSLYGKPTGKKIFYRVIADCLIHENRIVEEWLVRDHYYIITQLGLDPVALARKITPYSRQPVGDRRKLRPENDVGRIALTTKNIPPSPNPSVALVLEALQQLCLAHRFNSAPDYYHRDACLHAVGGEDFNGIPPIQTYYTGLFSSIPHAQIILDRVTCNTGAYVDKVAVRWTLIGKHENYGALGAPSGKEIHVVGITHYEIVDGKIREEWMVFDKFDVLCQIYADAERPAVGNLKQWMVSLFQKLNEARGSKQQTAAIWDKHMATDVVINAGLPWEEMQGREAYRRRFWEPLLNAFPDITIDPYIVMGGSGKEGYGVAVAGNLTGSFERDWVDIPAHGQPTWIRFQAYFVIKEFAITKAYYFLDLLDVMRQVGYPVVKSRGVEGVPPPPATGDGVVTYRVDEAQSRISAQKVDDMLAALLRYDGQDFASMGDLGAYWHAEHMMWYGPSGIGATRGLRGFQKNHQFPFLKAFPNRGILSEKQTGFMEFHAEGNYVYHIGFPAMYGSHTGDGWLGLKATGKKVSMRVMDFWRREGDLLKENWVMIDLIDLLAQLGVDVFAQLREKRKKHRSG